MSPINIHAQYLEPILRLWLERKGFDISKEFTIAFVKIQVKPGVDVYKEFGPCGPFPWYKIIVLDTTTNESIEDVPYITISKPTEKFSNDEVVIKEYNVYNLVGRSYTFIPNQVQVPDDLAAEEIERYKVPEMCESHEGLVLALHY
jgi:hypothetical protein